MNGESNNQKGNTKIIVISIIFLIFLSLLIFGGFKKTNNYNFFKFNYDNIPHVPSIKILIVGDMMLDRNVRNIINKKGFNYFFKGVKDLIKSPDIAIANLEGSFTAFESVTSNLKNKELKFTFDPALVQEVADLGFDALGLANNHSLNFGQEGLEMGKRYIGSAGMFYYGDPENNKEISTVITKNGIKVGFIGFNEFNYVNYDKIFKEIQILRPQVDLLIVTPHWGIEYDPKPTKGQIKWAHQFIDLGADVVIGSHSHIIGNIEEYKGKKIFYSLGNFSFDQYFSKETQEGMTVQMRVKKLAEGQIHIDFDFATVKVTRDGVSMGSSTSM